jgi:uncharacterized protein YbjT (DUF2867 family)
MSEVLVLGATGTVGRSLLDVLAARGVTVRGATRDPRLAAERCGDAARWVAFDLEDAGTFAGALDGVERVFMISRPGDEEADRWAGPLVEAMRARGVRHVVHLSAMGTEQRPDFSLRKVELLLEASGMAWTHLRPNFFMQVHATGLLCRAIRAGRRIALPAGDAALSFVDARDVAAVAAAVLIEAAAHAGRGYTLTGPEAVSYRRVAAEIGRAIGQDVAYVAIEDAAARGMLEAAGMAEPQIERLLAMYRLVRAGACAPVCADVETVLGRGGIRFGRFAADYAECWGGVARRER